jgi:uncharacterized protein (TIGR03067 family)
MEGDPRRSLEGTWDIVALEVDGRAVPESGFRGSSIVVKGNTFSTISMGATYGGTLAADAAKTPHTLDLKFKSGPEKGNTSLAIFTLDGDTWTLCLTVTGKERPTAFATRAGSGLALETLKRRTGPSAGDLLRDELARLGGTWTMVSGIRDGQTLPDSFVRTGKRIVKGNETTVYFGSEVFLKAAFTVDPAPAPKTIDYILTAGDDRGRSQLGIYALDGDTVTYCMAPPGRPRPAGFEIEAGVGGTTTVWKRSAR